MMGSIYKRGKTWWISYYKDGKQYRESTKSTTKAVAERRLKLREGEIAKGELPGVVYDQVAFEQLAEGLIRDYRINGKKSLERTRFSINQLARFFAGWKIPKITTPAIDHYIETRLDEGMANSTVNRELAALKRMLNLGAAQTPPLVQQVPKIRMLRENNARDGFFEYSEFLALKKVLPEYLKPFVEFAYKTGWRFSEISKLTWADVNKRTWSVKISGNRTKNREGRTVYPDEDLKAILQNLWSERKQSKVLLPYVFPNKDRSDRIKYIRKAWFSALKKAGLPRRLFHDLRRTAVRNMVRAGISENVAMKISGHKTRAIFDRYNITDDRDLQEAAKQQSLYLQSQNNHNLITIADFKGSKAQHFQS